MRMDEKIREAYGIVNDNPDILKIIRYFPDTINYGNPHHYFLIKRDNASDELIRDISEISKNNFNMAYICRSGDEILKGSDDFRNCFSKFLYDSFENLGDKKGVFIAIDDIHSLSKIPSFPLWYKGFFESMYFNDEFMPLALMMLGSEDDYSTLLDNNPSFPHMLSAVIW